MRVRLCRETGSWLSECQSTLLVQPDVRLRCRLLNRPLMQVFTVPVEDKYLVYRPLLRLAFVGNRAMANLVQDLARAKPANDIRPLEEAMAFLERIGFLEPDPEPPPLPGSSFPRTAVLLLTNRCNLRCTYCYASGGEGTPRDLSPEAARAVIDEACRNAKRQGGSHFDSTFHGGGEPTQAWSTLRQATDHARSKDLECRVSMVSNGVWSSRQREWVLENVDMLTISMDGRPATQNRQRPFASGRGSSREVMRTLQALDEAARSYGVRLTATAPWIGSVAEDVRFVCDNTDCRTMMVEPAFNTKRGQHRGPSVAEAKAFAAAYMEAFDVASRRGRRLTYSGARPWALTQAFRESP
jgi:uncharacterized protein